MSQPPYWVGFFEEDFYVIVANKIVDKTDKYRNECWRPYVGCDQIYSKKINGVTHRIFPSNPPKKIRLKRDYFVTGEHSPLLILKLKEELKKGNVILHLHGFPAGHNNHILREVNLRNTPVVVQHRGGSFKFEKYALMEKTIKNKMLAFLYKLYSSNIARHHLRDIDYFLVNTKSEANTIWKMGFKNLRLHKDGVDFNLFHKGDKETARKKLGISLNKKIILYIGKFYRDKGVDKIINVFESLKDKIEVHLILIGGGKEDELYQDSLDSGVTLIPRVKNMVLVNYCQASDITILIANPLLYKYAGLGRSIIEAWGCGVPFVSQNLVHFVGNENELKQLGEIPRNLKIDEIERCVRKIFNNPDNYSRCRQIAKKYYDLDVTIKQNLAVYSKCLKLYDQFQR